MDKVLGSLLMRAYCLVVSKERGGGDPVWDDCLSSWLRVRVGTRPHTVRTARTVLYSVLTFKCPMLSLVEGLQGGMVP